jgi:hypothetical protein
MCPGEFWIIVDAVDGADTACDICYVETECYNEKEKKNEANEKSWVRGMDSAWEYEDVDDEPWLNECLMQVCEDNIVNMDRR